MLDAEKLAKWSQGVWYNQPKQKLGSIHFDSRLIKKGQVFAALKTESQDGHAFLAAALDNQAGAAIVERIDPNLDMPQLLVADTLQAWQDIARSYRKTLDIRVIAITGSFGKTSTKDLLSLLLGSEQTFKTQGNFNNAIGVPFSIVQIDSSVHRFAIIEAGVSLPGEMDVLESIIKPDYVITTVIAPQHLEGLGSLEGIAEEKSKLIKGDSVTHFAHYSAYMQDAYRKLSADAHIIMPGTPTDGLKQYGELYGYNASDKGIEISSIDEQYFDMPSMHKGMQGNAVLAILAAQYLGIPIDLISERLKKWEPSGLRGRLYKTHDKQFYVDSYNAGPLSMELSLEHFNELSKGAQPRLYVIGAMNELAEKSEDYHYHLGLKLQLGLNDEVVLVNSKSHPAAKGLREQGVDESRVHCVDNAAKAQKMVDNFEGFVFLKGSNSYKLHELLPKEAADLS